MNKSAITVLMASVLAFGLPTIGSYAAEGKGEAAHSEKSEGAHNEKAEGKNDHGPAAMPALKPIGHDVLKGKKKHK